MTRRITTQVTLLLCLDTSLYSQERDSLVHEVVRQTPVTIKRGVWGKLTNVNEMQ